MIPRTVALLVLALVAAACTAPKNYARVQVDQTFGEFWDGFVAIAERQGYLLNPRETDRGMRVFTSHWRENPAPFGMGKRTRLHGTFERPEDGLDGEPIPGWELEFYVQRQVTKDMRAGFEPSESDWSDSGQDGMREDVILGQLRLRFGQDLGIAPSYRQSR